MEADIRVLKVDILQPPPEENHTYATQPDYNSTGHIVFKAKIAGVNYTGNIDWNVKLEYQTDGGGPYEKTYQFTSPNNQAVSRTFISEGGRLTIKASATVNGIQCSSEITNFITGVGIPDATITQRLRGLYTPLAGGTAGRLTGIAMNESSYRQFFNEYVEVRSYCKVACREHPKETRSTGKRQLYRNDAGSCYHEYGVGLAC